MSAVRGSLHHVELRVADLEAVRGPWGWLLGRLGYQPFQDWPDGCSWSCGEVYLVLERAPLVGSHDRRRPGFSHLALHAGGRAEVDLLWQDAPGHGWSRLYADRHPWAGGSPSEGSDGHYAAFLEDAERFKVELVGDC